MPIKDKVKFNIESTNMHCLDERLWVKHDMIAPVSRSYIVFSDAFG